MSGSDLYAAGYFQLADGKPANRIAKWDGSTWSPLGSGVEAFGGVYVYALAISGNDLYAGGAFWIAGGKLSPNIARAYLQLPALSILRSGSDLTLPGQGPTKPSHSNKTQALQTPTPGPTRTMPSPPMARPNAPRSQSLPPTTSSA